MRPQRSAAILLLLCLIVQACGSRLGDEERSIAIAGLGGGGAVAADGVTTGTAGTVAGTTSGGTTSGGTTSTMATSAGTGSATSGASGTTSSGTSSGASAPSAGGTTTTTSGGGDAPPADVDGEPDGDGEQPPPGDPGPDPVEPPAPPTDTRAAPPGGNGGETDIGVTADKIVLGNVSDVSGAVPGIFEPSQLAVKAYLAYFAATEGTIYGRQLEYLPKDGRLDTGANRSASIELCENAFMGVGSMSAMDQGAAPVIDECEIPDLRTSQTTDQMTAVDNAFGTSVSTAGLEGLGSYEWFAQNHPEAIKKASFVFICGEVTEQSTGALRKAQSEHLGFEYVYVQCIEIQETNYAPFVANMKDRGVEYVAFQGAYQQAVRLAETMRQQNYFPEAYVLQSNIYNRNFLELGGAAVEDSYILTSSTPVEEIEQHPELQLYAQWLAQVAPGEQPDGLGMFSWSAAKLTVELLKQIGPDLTRPKMLDAIRQVDGWTGGGLHGPASVGPRERPINCYNVLQVKGGAFAKVFPQGEPFTCSDLIVAV